MLAVLLLTLGSLSSDPVFNEGRALYDQLEYEQAVFRFQEVALRPELDAKDRAEALTWLGLSYAGAGNMDAARRAFVDAVVLAPEVALPVEVAPSLAQLFEDARQSAAARRAATDPAVPPSPAPQGPAPGLPLLPLAGVGAGAVVVLAGAGLAGLSVATFEGSKDKELFQTEAKAQVDAANLQLAVGSLLIPVGVAVGAASAFFLWPSGAP